MSKCLHFIFVARIERNLPNLFRIQESSLTLLHSCVTADVVHYITMNESSKPVGIMPNHLDLREITFTNLLLLDFNPAEMESKYRVVFNR